MALLISLWIQFFLCSILILFSGTKLCYCADIICEKTGLGKNWIGILLLAPITSLPEFFNGLSAILFVKAPDIAVGGILGSCVFNLFIIGLLDTTCSRFSITQRVQSNHYISAFLGISMLLLIMMDKLFFTKHFILGWMSGLNLSLIGMYFLSVYLIYGSESKRERGFKYKNITLKMALRQFLLNSFVITIAASWLPKVGERLAIITGFGQTFMGSFFIALSTSLPEMVVSFSALRIGSADMAIGNILGSNLINLCFLPIYDILFLKGPLLAFIKNVQTINIISAIIMTIIFIIDLGLKPKKWLYFGSLNIGLILIYILNSMILFYFRK